MFTQTVEYKEGDTLLEGYLAYDETLKSKRPGIVVVHEWKGLEEYAKHRAEMLALHGADDPMIKPEEVAAFEKEMKAAHVDYRLIKYPGAMHGFTNPHNKGVPPGVLYNEAADKASWAEMQKFFKEIF